jgi:hypothetical protein
VVSWFERDVFPFIGKKPIGPLRPPDILQLMKRMQARGIIDSMLRVLGYISKVFRFAMVKELADRDPTIGIADALEKRVESHFAAITEPGEAATLMRAIYGYAGHPVTCAALKLAPMLFQRPHMEERIDLIEHQLAHAVRDVNGQSYNRTTHLAARRDMMQRWADYLDRIRNGS